MTTSIWIRAEHKTNERRVAVVPEDASTLLKAGFKLTIEKSNQRAIPIEEYERLGCAIVAEGTWPDAPADTFILGVKELPKSDSDLIHRHIYFGHVFKDQPGWQHTLARFNSGGGTLYDLECLVDDNNRRVAAFGYWAGFAGAASAVMVWCGQQADCKPPLDKLQSYANVNILLEELAAKLNVYQRKPSMVVIGALGRSGSGAVDLAEKLSLKVSKWDMAETASGGPFPELQQHSIFVNCILATKDCPRFVTNEDINAKNRHLSVISDVSCDPESIYNPIPIYDQCTTFNNPVISILQGEVPLDLIAIDHLPSLLPLEASQDYSTQLSKALISLNRPEAGIWGRALAEFTKNMDRI
ncbi:MAG: saccharopine dehydrogenase [Pseudomonadales bacterium]|nr:saccharopine dehydrogenase [Pseudomonadales bacterium]